MRQGPFGMPSNATERGLRGMVVGRKNHYGSRSKRGTEVAALFYSLIETAKLSGVNPKTYLLEATHAALLNPGTALLPHALPAGRPGPSASTPAAVGKGGCLPLSCLRAVTD
jgi:transposase